MSREAPRARAPGRVDGGPLLVVISGPSGVGKDTVLAHLRERGLPIHFTITTTTRPPRDGDPEGQRGLTFVSQQEFQRLLANGALLEHAEVYGHHYGVPKAQVRDALARGQDVVVRVDVQGAATIKQLAPEAVLIFVAPPSLDELEERLRGRALDDEAALHRRLDTAEEELARSSTFDHVVVNERDNIDDAVEQVLEIMAAERQRPGRKPVQL
ncbi:MAG: guanylate kinase [Dehalococcoidia bacterium]